ncbi:radical SAM protein [Poseidonocella sedimentorum]|uniref:His-Xaa-Ser system radical SAM maturase HxsB n=1 Tax=Poseidonocella sedimentorum TaxID=871652 RepID=A0A1I6CVR5_9RHOB|nr:radical SAM protein [Poseidonocella sedimentorum]SFQ97355.1 His-Xaa-Ser system radical SAM maturase HxsB [Poseidonocella sedimentorum]
MSEVLASRLAAVNTARMAARQHARASVANYFILVPTLRCNLMCDYCQVSRVAERATGFDWDDTVLDEVTALILQSPATELTLEFQGGEPLLRTDLIRALRQRLSDAGRETRTVICTNLQVVGEDAWSLLAQPDVLISTSFDGTWAAHQRHRTQSPTATSVFRENLRRALDAFGSDRVSLTSTLDPANPPDPKEVIAEMRELDIRTLFLRPVNYQGFARKKFGGVREDAQWDQYYLAFIDQLIEDNLRHQITLGEYYFSYLLRRVLDPRRDEHVDLRNPAPLGRDYLVVGERGDIFPTDEARMLFRTGQIDLRIGHVSTGLDLAKIAQLNIHADNRTDPECGNCVYQAVCGRDLVDDISRYGRIDVPRHRTRHCQRHMAIFDHVMRKLVTAEAAELDVIARMCGLKAIDPAAYRPAHV